MYGIYSSIFKLTIIDTTMVGLVFSVKRTNKHTLTVIYSRRNCSQNTTGKRGVWAHVSQLRRQFLTALCANF